MNAWIKVVTHPLGLAGFALFLAFSITAKKIPARRPAWLTPLFFAMACAALLGGLVLSYRQVNRTVPPPTTVNQQRINQINQQSSGNGAVNNAGVQGGVTINNSSTTKAKKKAAQ